MEVFCGIILENSRPFLPFPVLTNFQLCRVCHGARVARLIRMARREGPLAHLAERKQAVPALGSSLFLRMTSQ